MTPTIEQLAERMHDAYWAGIEATWRNCFHLEQDAWRTLAGKMLAGEVEPTVADLVDYDESDDPYDLVFLPNEDDTRRTAAAAAELLNPQTTVAAVGAGAGEPAATPVAADEGAAGCAPAAPSPSSQPACSPSGARPGTGSGVPGAESPAPAGPEDSAAVAASGGEVTGPSDPRGPVTAESSRPVGIVTEAPSAGAGTGGGDRIPGVVPVPAEPRPLARGSQYHTSAGSLASTLRRFADALDVLGDRELPKTSLTVMVQVVEHSGASEADRIAAVDLLCGAIGAATRFNELEGGNVNYQEERGDFDGATTYVFTPRVTLPSPAAAEASPEPLPTCGPTAPRSHDWAMTPTRRRLISEVDHGEVYADGGHAYHSMLGRRYTRLVTEALAAGWVVEGSSTDAAGRPLYELTDAGRAAAAAYDESRAGAL